MRVSRSSLLPPDVLFCFFGGMPNAVSGAAGGGAKKRGTELFFGQVL